MGIAGIETYGLPAEPDPDRADDPDRSGVFARVLPEGSAAACRVEQLIQHRSVEADAHYARLDPEPIEIIEAWELDHNRACIVKYVARAPHKHNFELDMLKAAWYALRATGRKVRISDLYALGEK